MTDRDAFEYQRAQDALRWLHSPEYEVELRADIARREALTLAQGHSLKCGIMNCHPECRRPRPSWQGR